MYLSIYLSSWSINQSTNLSIYPSIYPSIYLSISLSLSLCLSVYLSASLKTKQFCDFFIFERNNIQKKTILRDFFIFCTCKAKQFCETSSIFELDNIKNKTILRDFLQKWKVECSADSLVPMSFAIFLLHLSKVLRLPRKIDARSYEVLHLSRKIILSKPTDLMLQNATPLRKWAPWPPNISHEHVFCTAPARENASSQILFKSPMPAIVFGIATKPSRIAHFWQDRQSLAPATQNDISTSKSGPMLRCFVHFDFEICFAPQQRALFRHLNFQKWSEVTVFCTFWLRNVPRATTACTFSTSQLPKVVREWCVFCTFWLRNVLRATTVCTFLTSQLPQVVRAWCVLHILTSKCASRHNGVQFFISHLVSWLRTRRLLFEPPEPQIIRKTQCFATSLPFRASASSFFWLFLFSDLLSSNLPLLSASALLCFSSVHIVGSLTSKLPSAIIFIVRAVVGQSQLLPPSMHFWYVHSWLVIQSLKLEDGLLTIVHWWKLGQFGEGISRMQLQDTFHCIRVSQIRVSSVWRVWAIHTLETIQLLPHTSFGFCDAHCNHWRVAM